mgnify:FL=1
MQIIQPSEKVPVPINQIVLRAEERSIIFNRNDGLLAVYNYDSDSEFEISKQNLIGMQNLVKTYFLMQRFFSGFEVNRELIFFNETNNYVWAKWITNERLWSFSETNEPMALRLMNDVAITCTKSENCVRFWNLNTFMLIGQSGCK